MGFYITEIIKKEDKSKLRKFLPKDYKFPKVKRGQIVISKDIAEQIATENFDFYDKLMRKTPCAK